MIKIFWGLAPFPRPPGGRELGGWRTATPLLNLPLPLLVKNLVRRPWRVHCGGQAGGGGVGCGKNFSAASNGTITIAAEKL